MAAGTILLVPSDEALLQKAIAGDRESLEELFQRYRQIAFRVAQRLLGNEADALDAVQDAFVKALTHLPSFQGRSSFKTWLLRVVSNAALDLGRQRGRREILSMDALGPKYREEYEPLTQPEPGHELERQDLRRKLQEALAQLPPAQRHTFVLHAEAEMSYREVAETLGISIGTVMSRLYYALAAFADLVGTLDQTAMKPFGQKSGNDWQPDPQLLAAYFDGELDGRPDLADLRARIEAWLEDHPEALGQDDENRQLRQVWRETTPVEPSSDTWNTLLERIATAGKNRPGTRKPWLGAGALAVSITLFFGLVFAALRFSLSTHTPEPAAVTVGHQKAQPIVVAAPKDAVEVFPVATADEVIILRVEGEDTAAMVVGQLPVQGPLELAAAGEIHIVRVQPDKHDQMLPKLIDRQDKSSRPMIWARLETERE